MKTVRGLNGREFEEKYGDNFKCVEFFADKKWENDFISGNCHHLYMRRGTKLPFKKCLKCRTEESPNAHTLFHTIKFYFVKRLG